MRTKPRLQFLHYHDAVLVKEQQLHEVLSEAQSRM
jgi:hypothetical protein